jgi:hypothetical protein
MSASKLNPGTFLNPVLFAIAFTLFPIIGFSNETQPPAKVAWVKGSGRVELKATPSHSSATISLLYTGETLVVLEQKQGIWTYVRSSQGKEGFVFKFTISEQPVVRNEISRTQKNEDHSLKEIRSRRSGAVTMGVRGLQARKENGAPEVQDFKSLERLEIESVNHLNSSLAQSLTQEIERTLPSY